MRKLPESWKFYLEVVVVLGIAYCVFALTNTPILTIVFIGVLSSLFLVAHLVRYGPRHPPERSLFRYWKKGPREPST